MQIRKLALFVMVLFVMVSSVHAAFDDGILSATNALQDLPIPDSLKHAFDGLSFSGTVNYEMTAESAATWAQRARDRLSGIPGGEELLKSLPGGAQALAIVDKLAGAKNDVLSRAADLTLTDYGTVQNIQKAMALKVDAQKLDIKPGDPVPQDIITKYELKDVKTVQNLDDQLRMLLRDTISQNQKELATHKELDLTIGRYAILYKGYTTAQKIIGSLIILLVLGGIGFAIYKAKKGGLKFKLPAGKKKAVITSGDLALSGLFKQKVDLLSKNKEKLATLLKKIGGPIDVISDESQKAEREWLSGVVEKLKVVNKEMLDGAKKYETFLEKFGKDIFTFRFQRTLDEDRKRIAAFTASLIKKHATGLPKLTKDKQLTITKSLDEVKDDLQKLREHIDTEERLVNPEFHAKFNELANAVRRLYLTVHAQQLLIDQEVEVLQTFIKGNVKHGTELQTLLHSVLEHSVNEMSGPLLEQERGALANIAQFEGSVGKSIEALSREEIEEMRLVELTDDHVHQIEQNEKYVTVRKGVKALVVKGKQITQLAQLEEEILDPRAIDDDALMDMLSNEGGRSKLADWLEKKWDNKELANDIDAIIAHYGTESLKPLRKLIRAAIEEYYPVRK